MPHLRRRARRFEEDPRQGAGARRRAGAEGALAPDRARPRVGRRHAPYGAAPDRADGRTVLLLPAPASGGLPGRRDRLRRGGLRRAPSPGAGRDPAGAHRFQAPDARNGPPPPGGRPGPLPPPPRPRAPGPTPSPPRPPHRSDAA